MIQSVQAAEYLLSRDPKHVLFKDNHTEKPGSRDCGEDKRLSVYLQMA